MNDRSEGGQLQSRWEATQKTWQKEFREAESWRLLFVFLIFSFGFFLLFWFGLICYVLVWFAPQSKFVGSFFLCCTCWLYLQGSPTDSSTSTIRVYVFRVRVWNHCRL